MRFAFLSTMNESAWGGSEELWSMAAGSALAEGDTILAMVPHFDSLHPRIQALRGARGEVRTWKNWITKRFVAKLLGSRGHGLLWRSLETFRPDIVVVSHGGMLDILQHPSLRHRLATTPVPYVVLVQCNTELASPDDPQRSALREYLRRAARVYFVSNQNLELARIQLADDLPNAEVIGNPLRFPASGAPRVRKPQEDAVRFACVARLDVMVKGYDILFRCLSSPAWLERRWTLEVHGQGRDREYLVDLARYLGLEDRVQFHGQTTDIPGVWDRCDLLLLASRMEGTPLALIEAMASSRPAVVTQVGGNPELVVDGNSGFLASSASVPSYSKALERAWERRHDWPEMGDLARERILSLPLNPESHLLSALRSIAEARGTERTLDRN